MSLVGRLDDLSIPDIIQIVHLSRRTGTLEIVDGAGTHTVVFSRGLVVSGTSPAYPHLVAGLDVSSMTPDALAAAIRDRIAAIVEPLVRNPDGEFTFHLADTVTAAEIGYDAKRVFKEGGLTAQKIFGTTDKEKLKTLRGLEESLKPGKALCSGAERVVPLPARCQKETQPVPAIALETPAPAVVKPAQRPRPSSVILFARNALVRVAIKRAFARLGVTIEQFGTPDDARNAVQRLTAAEEFFVTVLERTTEGSSDRLLQSIKRRNARLPVFVVE